jgi:hypothetical protein
MGLRELLRAERLAFEEAVLGYVQSHHDGQPTTEAPLAAHQALLPALERRFAGLAPLVVHDLDAFAEEVGELSELKRRLPVRGGYTFWPEIVDWCLWWLSYALGALACRHPR